MPIAGSLAALMKEWLLNSVTWSTATHSKLKEVLNGTDTQVATCTINRWTAKMKGVEEYITREISWRGGIAIRKIPESSSCIVLEEEKKNSSSDEARGQTFTPPPHLWRSCSLTILPDRWWSPRKGPVLEPTSLPNSLHWACWIWVRSHLQWRTPQIKTLQLVYLLFNDHEVWTIVFISILEIFW